MKYVRQISLFLTPMLIFLAGCENHQQEEKALFGTWVEQYVQQDSGGVLEMAVTLDSDKTFHQEVLFTAKNGDKTLEKFSGNWSLTKNELAMQYKSSTLDAIKVGYVDKSKIIKFSENEIVYQDDRTHVMTRKLSSVSASDVKDQKNAANRETNEMANEPVLLVDRTEFVPFEEVKPIYYELPYQMRAKLVIDIDSDVPVTIIGHYGTYGSVDFYNELTEAAAGTFVEMVDGPSNGNEAKSTTPMTVDTWVQRLFSHPFSKKDAYKHFESEWVTLKKGDHTVLIDNSGEIGTKRGDAPVRAQIWVAGP